MKRVEYIAQLLLNVPEEMVEGLLAELSEEEICRVYTFLQGSL